jgi:hypothetical protein
MQDFGSSASDPRELEEPGRINGENPPSLALVVAVEDSPWVPELSPDHERYAFFAGVLEHQDEWDADTHAGFWKVALELWPRKRGNRAHVGLLARSVDRWRQLGHSDSEIEAALNYGPGSLARMGVLSAAETYRLFMDERKLEAHGLEVVAHLEELIAAGAEAQGDDPTVSRQAVRRKHRRPRVVLAKDEHFEACWEPLSYRALRPADRERRDATLEQIQRAEERLAAQSNRPVGDPDPIQMDYETWIKAGSPRHLEVRDGQVYFDGQPSDFKLRDRKIVAKS